jgi:HD-GYP domain-containing protein (c-di-GMP phosphodiesterase class II)
MGGAELMEKINFDLNQFFNTMSYLLDFVEVDVFSASVNHSRRIAYVALRLAEKFELSNDEKCDLATYCFLHDNGISQEMLTAGIAAKRMTKLQRLEGLKLHCTEGQGNISEIPFINNNQPILKFHHENYDGTGFFRLEGTEIPLMSAIISMVDYLDNMYHLQENNHQNVNTFVRANVGKRFSRELASAFLSLNTNDKFRYDLKDFAIERSLSDLLIPNVKILDWKEVFNIAKIFSKIIDSRSKYTENHTGNIIRTAEIAAEYYGFDENEKYKFLIAAALHDIGRLTLRSSLLEKKEKLTNEQVQLLKSHSYYTKFALHQIYNFGDISNWAANHHEKLNKKGYPEGLGAQELDFNSRLLACLDIYQAFREERPYRKGLSYQQTYTMMQKMVLSKSIDAGIINDFIPTLTQKLRMEM